MLLRILWRLSTSKFLLYTSDEANHSLEYRKSILQSMSKIVDFIHNYSGFHGISSSCHIRILNDDDKPLVVICSQLPSNRGTSVTNVAEHIASEICKQLSENNQTLKDAIEGYVSEYKGYEMLEHLIQKLKDSGKYSIFFLEILKQALKFRTESKQATERLKNLIWVEHYPPGVGFHTYTHEYALVTFEKDTWNPNWSNWVTAESISDQIHYSVEEIMLAGVELS